MDTEKALVEWVNVWEALRARGQYTANARIYTITGLSVAEPSSWVNTDGSLLLGLCLRV